MRREINYRREITLGITHVHINGKRLCIINLIQPETCEISRVFALRPFSAAYS